MSALLVFVAPRWSAPPPTLRLRTNRTKGCGSRVACLAVVFKLGQAAERKWRNLNGYELLGEVIRGVQFKDGTKVAA